MTSRVEVDGDELIATRVVDADQQLVWHAFTEPEHLAAFWGGRHATVPAESVIVDLRPGGTFELRTLGPDGAAHPLHFVYDVVEAPSRLVFTEASTGIVTTVRLDPTGTGTTVTIHQRRVPPELRGPQAMSGLAGMLDHLDDVLRRLAPRDPST